jgi:hypothetical protein
LERGGAEHPVDALCLDTQALPQGLAHAPEDRLLVGVNGLLGKPANGVR